MDITDEIPFVIPETWQWVRIRDVFQLNPKNEAEDEKLVAFIPMEKISAGYKSDFTFDTAKWGTVKKGFTHFANGDVAFAKITPCFQNRKSPDFVIVSPKILRQRVLLFSDVLPSALFGYKPPCSKVA